MSTNEKRTVDVIAAQYGFSASNIKPELQLVEDLEGDSLDQVELIMALEDEFNIVIPDEELDKLKTVADVHALVAKFVKEAS